MDLARYIDHTLLAADATPQAVARLCAEAREHRFAAVCVNPLYVPEAVAALAGSGVLTATVAGFPLGATTTATKVAEAREAIAAGAAEVDMVMAIGRFKAGDHKAVRREIAQVVAACGDRPVKVILETCLLTPEEVAAAARIAAEAGAAFVKTSTGFGSRGASIEDVRIMQQAVAGRCQIKASGGIRTREQALAMIEAGATRIGTSCGVAIVSGS